MLFICIRWVGLIGFKGGEPFQKWWAIIIMASFKEGQTKNDRCKEQWFALICMTACRKKKAFLFFYFYWTLLGIFIAEKRVLKLHSWAVFSSMNRYKEDTTLCGLHTLLQVQNSSFWTTGIRRRQNFEIILKVKQQSIGVLLMLILSSPLLSLIFFSFAGYLVRLMSVEKFWGKAFRNWG